MTRPVAVLAGGLGTRVAHLAGSRPKGMLPVAGRPFIDLKLEGLAAEGVGRVVLLVGHGADSIERHVGTGDRYGLTVTCVRDGPELLGTGGAVAASIDRLGETFWVTYGDTLLRVPMTAVENHLGRRGGLGVMTVLANQDRWETSNVSVLDGDVVAYDKAAPPPGSHRYIDYGMLLFDAEAFADHPSAGSFDLTEVIAGLVRRRALGAFEVTDRFYDVGTEPRYSETCRLADGGALWSPSDP